MATMMLCARSQSSLLMLCASQHGPPRVLPSDGCIWHHTSTSFLHSHVQSWPLSTKLSLYTISCVYITSIKYVSIRLQMQLTGLISEPFSQYFVCLL